MMMSGVLAVLYGILAAIGTCRALRRSSLTRTGDDRDDMVEVFAGPRCDALARLPGRPRPAARRPPEHRAGRMPPPAIRRHQPGCRTPFAMAHRGPATVTQQPVVTGHVLRPVEGACRCPPSGVTARTRASRFRLPVAMIVVAAVCAVVGAAASVALPLRPHEQRRCMRADAVRVADGDVRVRVATETLASGATLLHLCSDRGAPEILAWSATAGPLGGARDETMVTILRFGPAQAFGGPVPDDGTAWHLTLTVQTAVRRSQPMSVHLPS